ncbi:tyrosine-type recombinase/integrase [Burkholderia sp. S-53]|uniref:tyrosine-type recombinase/integrase n=1 Tax=Burkholderia sp. S-53 TaxID=2906514 RepID=UPI0021D3E0BE|nr:tyrosine-type recombinase/integrase [Burkholderia sp. S-53]UXU91441.1 tyrosine-type recombinase/integrase [Burkholderia sp. S-53]
MSKESIRSRTARAKLRHQNEPFWDAIRRGLHVGYRTSSVGPGTWVGRLYHGKRYHHVTLDGQPEFDEARKRVEQWADELTKGTAKKADSPDTPLTVEDGCRKYVEDLESRKGAKSAYDASNRFERLVYGKTIGKTMLALLESKHIEAWRDAQTKEAVGEEDIRKARDSANRNLKSLKAALNYSRKNKWVTNDLEWKVVSYFEKVDMGRDGFLTIEQRKRLLDAMPDDLRLFATALMLLGCRPGELAKAQVSDYNPHTGTLTLRPSKTKSRTLSLSTKARELFDARVKDRDRKAFLFMTDRHNKWTVDSWHSRFVKAREKAGMPEAVLYFARHSFISELLTQGVPIHDVSKFTGTSAKHVDKNYGHLTKEGQDRINRIEIL